MLRPLFLLPVLPGVAHPSGRETFLILEQVVRRSDAILKVERWAAPVRTETVAAGKKAGRSRRPGSARSSARVLRRRKLRSRRRLRPRLRPRLRRGLDPFPGHFRFDLADLLRTGWERQGSRRDVDDWREPLERHRLASAS